MAKKPENNYLVKKTPKHKPSHDRSLPLCFTHTYRYHRVLMLLDFVLTLCLQWKYWQAAPYQQSEITYRQVRK